MLTGTRTILPELCSMAGSSMRQTSIRRLATSAQAGLEASSSSSPSASPSTSSSLSFGRTRNSTPISSPVTAQKASDHLSSLLSLPASRRFPESLALRILTHKSYRGAQVLGQGYHSRTSSSTLTSDQPQSPSQNDVSGSAGHNARLTFLGKRAMLSYLLMFIHQHALDTSRPIGLELEGLSKMLDMKNNGNAIKTYEDQALSQAEFGGKQMDLETKLENLVNLSNLGRTVGSRWGLEHVMRWQSNLTGDQAQSRDSGALKIYGEGVQAVMGGTMMHFGSPAAQRLFHLQILPTLAPQLRDPALVESVDKMRAMIVKEMGGEKCVVV